MPEQSENLISYKEAAELIGVAEITVRKWTSTRFIPHYKLGKSVRFSKTELMEWVRSKHVDPVPRAGRR
ncbi:MAG: helix-turn-helix domain-containing protein [Spirochaetaceae bacterium]|nr:helix-turn-helix domain-containing protein [Spirochaetaceae bacterium]MCF7948534.1 helix-turn-helix domain-containing protein [Spirochaetia bacterium]MCF7951012.1 helix-turn-helix domain-containing protein [Spirochaetaceae bacterium]